MKLEFVCIEVSPPNPTGQKATLRIPAPPPEPVANGYGNPIAHPRPFGGAMQLFVASEERRDVLRKVSAVERRIKRLKFEVSQPREELETKALQDELNKRNFELADLMKELEKAAAKEFKFEHGAVYDVTFTKRAK